MDLRILEIASHTENNKILENFTHKSKNKDKMQNAIIGAVESNSSLKFDTNPNSNTVTITRK